MTGGCVDERALLRTARSKAAVLQISPLYPRMKEFREMVRGLDSEGKFENGYLGEHVGPARTARVGMTG